MGPGAVARLELTRSYSKLADWDDDDPAAIPTINPKFEKTVILKNMFTLKELEVREAL